MVQGGLRQLDDGFVKSIAFDRENEVAAAVATDWAALSRPAPCISSAPPHVPSRKVHISDS